MLRSHFMEFRDELKTLKDQVKFGESFKVDSFSNIVIAGMGGSGIAGRIFSEMYSDKPVFVSDDYSIPNFVDENTEFIAVSYSGNTEETLSAVEAAMKKGAKVHAITSGGKLGEMGIDTIKIPSGLQPRSAVGYLTMPIINTFIKPSPDDVDETSRILADLDANNTVQENIATEIFAGRRIPVIYGASPFRSIAYRWKTQFNENAKVLAYSSYFSELNHNDTMPMRDTYRKDEFYFMAFDSEDERIRKRIEVTQKITGTQFKKIDLKGTSLFARSFYLIHVGDYLTYHLARLRGIDPRDVSAIEDLKKRIA
ncbi:bifunctional phosphoglucose/phosphomannose isomerase [Thermoplasma sp. Kam2015]|nr:bifunctional phosphoglucose/phosphomannose isomerase [Thermoplasma sp. Kam2015]